MNWKEYAQRNVLGLSMALALFVVALHYIFFVSKISDDRDCRGKYNYEVVKAQFQLQTLLKDSYDNQNRLTVEYAAATAREVPERQDEKFNAEVQEVFAAHYKRIAELDKRFNDLIKLPEPPSCFT